MPLSEKDEKDVKRRLLSMFMDTIKTFRLISEFADKYFGENAKELKEAIDEYLHDFIDHPDGKERIHPEVLIYGTWTLTIKSALDAP